MGRITIQVSGSAFYAPVHRTPSNHTQLQLYASAEGKTDSEGGSWSNFAKSRGRVSCAQGAECSLADWDLHTQCSDQFPAFLSWRKGDVGVSLELNSQLWAALLFRRLASASLYLDFASETVKIYAFSPSLVWRQKKNLSLNKFNLVSDAQHFRKRFCNFHQHFCFCL